MKKLIIHLEYCDELQEGDITLDLDDLLSGYQVALQTEDIGWRYFNSLEAAQEWEQGKSG